MNRGQLRIAECGLRIVVLASALLIFDARPLFAQTALEKRLETALANVAPAHVGLIVHNRDGGAVFERNADEPLKPASVLKLFTTAAALHRFGPQWSLYTSVYMAGDELWVLGGGDPGLGDERLAARDGQTVMAVLERWVGLLKQRGVTQVSDIVLDDYIFDSEWRNPDWEPDQYLAWYQAPVGGLNFNDNCLDARLELSGGAAKLALTPPLPAEFIDNQIRVGRKHGLAARRPFESDIFEFRGSAAKAEDLGTLSVRRPNVFFGQALRQALESNGIKVRGEVVRRRIGESLGRATLLDVHATSLRDVVWRCNTFSQNFFAECLCKSLGAYNDDGQRSGQAGGWGVGTAAVRSILSGLGLDLKAAVFRDGSGLSHENRVTARQIVALLETERRAAHAQVFVESLALAGQDGTLRRYKAAPLAGHLRAKTGTLTNVHSMAGFVERGDGSSWTFAILANGSDAAGVPERVAQALAAP